MHILDLEIQFTHLYARYQGLVEATVEGTGSEEGIGDEEGPGEKPCGHGTDYEKMVWSSIERGVDGVERIDDD